MLRKQLMIALLILPLGGCWSLLGLAGGTTAGVMVADKTQNQGSFTSKATGRRATGTEVEAELYKRRMLSGEMPPPGQVRPAAAAPPPQPMQAMRPPPMAAAPMAPPPQAFPNDKAIADSINQRMLGGDLTKAVTIHSVVRNGEVDLYGNVPHQAIADRAIRTALATPGVRRVNSHLTVVRLSDPDPVVAAPVPPAPEPQIIKIPPPAVAKPAPKAPAPVVPQKSQAEITREQILNRKAAMEKQLSGG